MPFSTMCKHIYCNVPSKCPWVLIIHGPKIGVGAYMEKPSEHTQQPHHLQRGGGGGGGGV